ncbi:MAG TPA: hypothetical protein PKX91_00805 [Clostridia bacterium]|nr:hypothetical protein [Clostridia bacterium]
MKKNKIIIFVLVAACIISLLLVGCSTKAESKFNTEILKGAEGNAENFKYTSIDELSEVWDMEYPVSQPFSVSSTSGLSIDTSDNGYVSLTKKVFLKPHSYYKVEYDCKITEIGRFNDDTEFIQGHGLYVGFKEDASFNVVGDKTAQESVTCNDKTRVFYFKTSGSSEYNISLNFGSEQFPVKGKGEVSRLSLMRVTKSAATEGAVEAGLDVLQLKATVFGMTKTSNLPYVILGAIATVVLAYFAFIMQSRNMAFADVEKTNNTLYNKIKDSKCLGLIIVLGLGAIVRLAIMLTQTIMAGGEHISKVFFGYNLENLSAQGTWIAKHGTPYFYQFNEKSMFLPIPLYLSALAGLIGQGLYGIKGVDSNTVALAVVAINKLFAIFADLGAIVIIYKAIEKNQGKTTATIMAGAYSLLPIVFTMSSAWGAVESIASLLIVSTFYCILDKNYIGMSVSFFLAALTSTLSLLFIPAVLLYTIFLTIDGFKEKKYKQLIVILVTIISSLVLFYLITLPLNFADIQSGKGFIAFDRFITLVADKNVYTQNAFNFQALLKNNYVDITLQSKVVDIIFVVFILLVLSAVYLKSRNRLSLSFIGVGAAILIWTFSVKMKPEALYMVLGIFFMVAVCLKDIRVYIGFILYAVFSYINNSYVYLMVGYTEEGVSAITYENNAILYVFGAISLVLAIYIIVVGYDVLVNKKTVPHKAMTEVYTQYVKRTTKNVLISVSNGFAIVSAWFKEFGRAAKEDIQERNEIRKIKAQERKLAREKTDEPTGTDNESDDVVEKEDIQEEKKTNKSNAQEKQLTRKKSAGPTETDNETEEVDEKIE